jgi:hypothetical protein
LVSEIIWHCHISVLLADVVPKNIVVCVLQECALYSVVKWAWSYSVPAYSNAYIFVVLFILFVYLFYFSFVYFIHLFFYLFIYFFFSFLLFGNHSKPVTKYIKGCSIQQQARRKRGWFAWPDISLFTISTHIFIVTFS